MRLPETVRILRLLQQLIKLQRAASPVIFCHKGDRLPVPAQSNSPGTFPQESQHAVKWLSKEIIG